MSWDAVSTPVEKVNNVGFSSVSSSSSPAESSSISVVSVTSAELQAAYNAGLAAATTGISHMHISDDTEAMIAYHAQQCKFHNIYSMPPSNKSNMIIVPIVIENIKTYAILDTGATISIISPSFASFLSDRV
ncbi:hypothetical protein BD770DRAFT_395597, partial [Pilaira anomala]